MTAERVAVVLMAYGTPRTPDEIDDGLEDRWVGVGLNTVAEVEDVAGVLAAVGQFVVAQDLEGAVERGFATGESQRRVEVALDDQVVAEAAAGIGDRGAPVEAQDGGSGIEHGGEQVVAADAEVDRRCIGMAPTQLTEHVARVRQDVAVVVATAQRAGPRVEQLVGGSAVGQLCVDERDR